MKFPKQDIGVGVEQHNMLCARCLCELDDMAVNVLDEKGMKALHGRPLLICKSCANVWKSAILKASTEEGESGYEY